MSEKTLASLDSDLTATWELLLSAEIVLVKSQQRVDQLRQQVDRLRYEIVHFKQ